MTNRPFTHGTMCSKKNEQKTVERIKKDDPTARDFIFGECAVSGRSHIRYTSDLPLPKQPV